MEHFKLTKTPDPDPFSNSIFFKWRSYLGLVIVIIISLICAGILVWVYFGGNIENGEEPIKALKETRMLLRIITLSQIELSTIDINRKIGGFNYGKCI